MNNLKMKTLKLKLNLWLKKLLLMPVLALKLFTVLKMEKPLKKPLN